MALFSSSHWRPVLGFRLLAWANVLFVFGLLVQSQPVSNPVQKTSLVRRDLHQEFTVRAWQTEDGLLENNLTSLVQTPDGYLWISSLSGLVRFDGQRMVEFNSLSTPALVSSRIVRLGLDRRGRLWILSAFGDVAYYESGRFYNPGAGSQTMDRGVVTLGEDEEGRIWAGGSFAEWNGWRLIFGKPGQARGVIRAIVSRHSLVTDEEGRIWENTSVMHQIHVLGVDGRKTRWFPPDDAGDLLHGVCPSPRGGIWICGSRAFYRIFNGKVVERRSAEMVFRDAGAMMEDGAGTLWVAGWKAGFFRIPMQGVGSAYSINSADGEPSVNCLFVDREQNFWIGLGGQGLRMLRPRTVQMLQEATLETGVRSVAQDVSGQIWAASSGALVLISPTNRTARVLALPGVELPRTLLPHPGSGVFVGLYSGGVLHVNETGVQREFPLNIPGMTEVSTTVLMQDRRGTRWVGTSGGLFRLQETNVVREPIPTELPEEIRAMAHGIQGELYVAPEGRGLWVQRLGGRWEQLTLRDGLPDDNVTALHADASGVLWIGTAHAGLACLRDGNVQNFQGRGLQLPESITCFVEDGAGSLWIGSKRGIHLVGIKDLLDYLDGRSRDLPQIHLDRAHGMATSECASGRQPTAIRASDGSLWFATSRGMAVIDPTQLRRNTLPPPVHIEEVRLDGRSIPPAEAGKIPAETSRLEIRYTGLSFSDPSKNRFRHRLEGLESDWVDARTERVAHYTRLGPGQYTFRVEASNNDGVWNETGAALALHVLPNWWQTFWFKASAIGFLTGLGLILHRLRVSLLMRSRALQEEFSRKLLQSQESERKRIAGELHDGLGQNLLIIKNRAMLGLQKQTDAPAMAQEFEDISSAASRAVREVRDLAHNLRPYQIDELGITRGIQSAVGALLKSAGIEFVHRLDRIDGLLPAEFEINLFRIIQETINNVVKHSGAARVELTLRRGTDRIELSVVDDGRGFELTRVDGSFGLSGMMERTRIMGGEFRIRSEPGFGTTVELEVPIPRSKLPHHG